MMKTLRLSCHRLSSCFNCEGYKHHSIFNISFPGLLGLKPYTCLIRIPQRLIVYTCQEGSYLAQRRCAFQLQNIYFLQLLSIYSTAKTADTTEPRNSSGQTWMECAGVWDFCNCWNRRKGDRKKSSAWRRGRNLLLKTGLEKGMMDPQGTNQRTLTSTLEALLGQLGCSSPHFSEASICSRQHSFPPKECHPSQLLCRSSNNHQDST